MALYESTFIVRQDIPAQEIDKITDNFTKVITANKGTVAKKENWGLRNLAYKVKKNKKGYYIHLGIDIPNIDGINELQRQYKLSEDVIRYMTVKVANLPKEPSPLLDKKPAYTKKSDAK